MKTFLDDIRDPKIEIILNQTTFFHTIDDHESLKQHLDDLDLDLEDRRTFFTEENGSDINQVFIIKKAHLLNAKLNISFEYQHCTFGVGSNAITDDKELEVLLVYEINNQLA